jgi:hypothetical protein
VAVHIGDGEIDVRADLSGVQDDVDKGIKRSLNSAEDEFAKAGKRSGGGFGAAFGGAVTGVLTGGGLQQIAGFLGDSLKDAADANRISAIVTNTIEQTGAAARGVTKKAFDGVSEEIAKSLVVDDDDIAAGLAPLLRIPDLTKPVFDELAKVAADTSAATGKDLEGVSKALSKLGTDPEGAIGALKALGVTVQDTTKDTVKGLVEQGDSAGALNVLLDELKGRYEGAAKAAGDTVSPQQRLAVAMGDFREKIGGGLLTLVDKLMTALKDPQVAAFLERLKEALMGVVDTVRDNWPAIQATISGVVDAVLTIWDNFGSQITAVIVTVFNFVKGTIENALQVIKGIIEVVTGIIHGDWSQVWEGVRDIFGGLFDQILNIARTVLGLIQQALSVALEIIVSTVEGAIGGVIDLFISLPGRLVDALSGAASWLIDIGKDIVNGLISGIGSLAGAVVDALLGLIPGPLKRFASRLGIGSPSKVFHNFGENIGQGLAQGIKATLALVTDATAALAQAAAPPLLSAGGNQINEDDPRWNWATMGNKRRGWLDDLGRQWIETADGRIFQGTADQDPGTSVAKTSLNGVSWSDVVKANTGGTQITVNANGVGVDELADIVARRVAATLGLMAAI